MQEEEAAERKRKILQQQEQDELDAVLALSASATKSSRTVHAEAGSASDPAELARQKEQEDLDLAIALSMSTPRKGCPDAGASSARSPDRWVPRVPPPPEAARRAVPTYDATTEEDSCQLVDDDDSTHEEDSVQLLDSTAHDAYMEEDSVQLIEDDDPLPPNAAPQPATTSTPSAKSRGKQPAACTSITSLSDSDDDLPFIELTGTSPRKPAVRGIAGHAGRAASPDRGTVCSKRGSTARAGSPAAAAIVRRPHRRGPLRAFSIVIDNRERTKNDNPREMMNILKKQCAERWETDMVGREQWLADRVSCDVQQRKLELGDFSYSTQPGTAIASVAIERKTIGDLVGRSAKGDHIRQLDKMTDLVDHPFFALEGDPKFAAG
jgi:hypothetical protein